MLAIAGPFEKREIDGIADAIRALFTKRSTFLCSAKTLVDKCPWLFEFILPYTELGTYLSALQHGGFNVTIEESCTSPEDSIALCVRPNGSKHLPSDVPCRFHFTSKGPKAEDGKYKLVEIYTQNGRYDSDFALPA